MEINLGIVVHGRGYGEVVPAGSGSQFIGMLVTSRVGVQLAGVGVDVFYLYVGPVAFV